MPLSEFERTLADVAESLRNSRGHGCSLLIGAGCSATSNIPLASEFVQELAQQYPRAFERAQNKTYPHCMAELAYKERSDLIAPHIDRARINWAHVAIAQLTKAGYVTRILTTNFDPLVVKACATVGVYPAVYDLAASQEFRADLVYEPSVFYLHGQRAGFVTLHTENEVQRHKKTLEPVFADAGRDRIWIVCGYSGDNDPVFEHLAEVPAFARNLYWVGYKATPPSDHVRDRLLVGGKYAFYVPGYDADTFFVELARLLECFPPEIIAKPFTHLMAVTDLLADFTIGDSTTDLRQIARTRIQAAIDQFEKGEAVAEGAELQPEALDAMALVFSGKYDEVLAQFERTENPSDELRDAAAWALIAQGSSLDDEARTKSGAEADALWAAAGEKYGAALQIKPDKYEALYNWGNALADQAKTKSGAEADALWATAGEKYGAALQIKPDKYEALYNWGNALAAQARTKSGAEADALWAAAGEKYGAALQIKPDKHEALYNWGSALAAQARTKSGAEADALWAAAGEKYGAALQIKPDKHEALYNWGIALAAQARTKRGAEADALWAAAGEKYGAALQIKPDKHEALNNWASALLTQARFAPLDIREELIDSAMTKCESANKIVPGSGSYNMACAYGIRGDADACRRWLVDAREHGKLPSREHLLNDPDLASVREHPWFAELLSEK
jgi:cytochrome c-type biogenesis protein CcmH/NrfG/NAD-dependent SIR2 family protein deacetylase